MSNPFSNTTEMSSLQQVTPLPSSFTVSPASVPPAGQFSSSSLGMSRLPQSSDTSPTMGTSRGGDCSNPATLCRVGQDVLLEIMQKTTEIFNYVQSTQLPNGITTKHQQFIDRKSKLDEPARKVKDLFSRLRETYDNVVAMSATIEPRAVEELIPIQEPDDPLVNQSLPVQSLKYSSDEEKRLTELLRLKNRQLKKIIDHQRIIVAEINTMLTMKKSQDK